MNSKDKLELMLHVRSMLDDLREIAISSYEEVFNNKPNETELEFFCLGVSLGVCLNDKKFIKEFMKNEKSNRKNS